MKEMKNKSGFLLAEETLKIVVAVICIVFLVYLLVSLYFGRVQSENIKKAQSSMDRISTIVTAGGGNVDALVPEGWFVFSFTGSDKKPNSCAGENCLCICDKITSINFWSSQEIKCGDDGVCLIVKNLRSFNPIKIKDASEGLTSIQILNQRGEISVRLI